MSSEVLVVECGTVPYEESRELQRRLAGARQRGEIADVLLLLEHPPVYTRGRRSQPAELPMGVEWYEAQGIEVRDTDRGGLVTYHGPGQLVAYPIVDLAPFGGDDTGEEGGGDRAGQRTGRGGEDGEAAAAGLQAAQRGEPEGDAEGEGELAVGEQGDDTGGEPEGRPAGLARAGGSAAPRARRRPRGRR